MHKVFCLLLLPGLGCHQAAVQEAKPPESKALVYVDKAARARPHAHPRGKYSDKFPDIVLTDHEGKEHRFYSDLVRDRIVIVQFFYTVCNGI